MSMPDEESTSKRLYEISERTNIRGVLILLSEKPLMGVGEILTEAKNFLNRRQRRKQRKECLLRYLCFLLLDEVLIACLLLGVSGG